LTFVAALIGYHIWCYRLLVAFRENRNRHAQGWYRAFNEIPTVLLLIILVLVVVKPF
jgi:putative membrane protein